MRRALPFLAGAFSFCIGWAVCLAIDTRSPHSLESPAPLPGPVHTVLRPTLPPSTTTHVGKVSEQPSDEAATASVANPQPAGDTLPGTNLRFVTATEGTGDWPQWGGDSQRNNTPIATNVPDDWQVGKLDRATGEWDNSQARHIKWVAPVGSQTYGNPVVADGQLYVGTNNSHGYLARYPGNIDLGCLLALSAEDGRFLWQDSSEKLSTGRVHDWPLQGICCAPYVQGDRLWYVSSRGEVVCLDTRGFHDDEDDGPIQGGVANLFKVPPMAHDGLDATRLPEAIEATLQAHGHTVGDRWRVQVEEAGKSWIVSLRRDRQKQFFRVQHQDDQLVISNEGIGRTLENAEPDAEATDAASNTITIPIDLSSGLANGTAGATLRNLLKARGVDLPKDVTIESETPNQWNISAKLNGSVRKIVIRRQGPNLVGYRLTTIDDKEEADRVWVYNMMQELGVSQHNMCSCSITGYGDILFVNTSNGVDESHKNIPSVKAPSFIAMDKNSGKVLWTDGSPGPNILHGQWSSPSVGILGGVAQVIFAGGDGWVYSFQADAGENGKPTLLWKFDANPKESEWILNGNGTRNNIIATPVLYKDRVYVAVGQDPEHGPGEGHLWCIDPTLRGDISSHLVVNIDDRKTIVPPRRLKAMEETQGEVSIDNPNSGVVWHYDKVDQNGDGEFEVPETMNRSCGTVAIKDDILFIADFSGIFHCLDAMTGKVHWTYDMFGCAWGSPLIVDGKVMIGDEDGEVAIFKFSKEPQEPYAEIDMLNSVYSTPIIANNVLYISNKTHVFAIEKETP